MNNFTEFLTKGQHEKSGNIKKDKGFIVNSWGQTCGWHVS